MRSSLILLAVLGALVVQASATAQRAARVGILGSMDDPRFADLVNGLRQGLANHGHLPDAVTLVENQVPRGDEASARRAVEAFTRQRGVPLFVVGTELTKIARERAPEVPIVFITPGDPARLGLSLVVKEVRSRDDLLRGLDALAGIDAVLGIPGGVTASHDALIVRHAHVRRLPTVFSATSIAASEAVISYGATTVGIAHQVARTLDRILKGVNAGDIPVERPSTLEFVLNMRVARALGLTVPPSLRIRADRVSE